MRPLFEIILSEYPLIYAAFKVQNCMKMAINQGKSFKNVFNNFFALILFDVFFKYLNAIIAILVDVLVDNT